MVFIVVFMAWISFSCCLRISLNRCKDFLACDVPSVAVSLRLRSGEAQPRSCSRIAASAPGVEVEVEASGSDASPFGGSGGIASGSEAAKQSPLFNAEDDGVEGEETRREGNAEDDFPPSMTGQGLSIFRKRSASAADNLSIQAVYLCQPVFISSH